MTLQLITKKINGHPDWTGDTLEDLSDFVSKEKSNGKLILYRGQDASWPLLPYVSRINQKSPQWLAIVQLLPSFSVGQIMLSFSSHKTD